MPKGETGARLTRLDELRWLLAARDFTTAAELATELGVSVRTSNRVLASISRPSPAVARTLLAAFAEQKVAVIDYRDGRGVRTKRTIEAPYLY